MSIEYIDGFEVQTASSGRYARGVGGSRQNGRGTTHLGSMSINSSGYSGRAVTPEATKGQAIAQKLNALVKTGIFVFAESGGATRHIYIGVTSTGHIEVRRGDNNGTVLTTSTAAPALAGSYVHYEAKVTISDTVGVVRVKANEVEIINITGQDTKNGGTSGLIEECWVGSDDGNNDTNYDDWFIWNTSGSVHNDFIGDRRVGYAAANVAGTYSVGTASSGTLLSCVDEIVSNADTDYISQDNTSLPKAVSFGLENAPSNTLSVLAVQVYASVRKDDAGSNLGRLLLISGATENDGGADLTVNTAYLDQIRLHETDPNTSAAWTITNFNAIEAGWRRVA